MNVNPWACPKSREIRRVLVSLDESVARSCDIAPDNGNDPHIVTLRHTELETLRAHVYLASAPAPTAFSSNIRTRYPACWKRKKTCPCRNCWPAWPCISTPEQRSRRPGLQGLRQQDGNVHRGPPRPILDLMPAGKAVRHNRRIGWR